MRPVFLIWIALVMVGIAGAADVPSPWTGTWRLNRAKSQMTGGTFSYSRTETGMLHYTNGGAVSYDFQCDGKEYPTVSGRTMSCTKVSETIFESTTRMDGHTLTVSHRLLSDDGKTMKTETSGIQPDGTTFTDRNTYQRVSGVRGLVGTWRNVKAQSTTPESEVIWVRNGMMHTEFPGYQDHVDAKLDGTEAPFVGPTLPAGLSVILKVESARRIHVYQKLNGRMVGETVQTLSVDGRMLTETSWATGKATERQTLVYDKQ